MWNEQSTAETCTSNTRKRKKKQLCKDAAAATCIQYLQLSMTATCSARILLVFRPGHLSQVHDILTIIFRQWTVLSRLSWPKPHSASSRNGRSWSALCYFHTKMNYSGRISGRYPLLSLKAIGNPKHSELLSVDLFTCPTCNEDNSGRAILDPASDNDVLASLPFGISNKSILHLRV